MGLLISLLTLRGRVLNPPHSSVVVLAQPVLLPRKTSWVFPHLASCKKESFLPACFPDIFEGKRVPKAGLHHPVLNAPSFLGTLWFPPMPWG